MGYNMNVTVPSDKQSKIIYRDIPQVFYSGLEVYTTIIWIAYPFLIKWGFGVVHGRKNGEPIDDFSHDSNP